MQYVINIPRLFRATYRYRASVVVYLFIGGVSAVINWIVFYMCNAWLQWHYIMAALGAFVVATGVNFILSERVGFISGGRSKARIMFGVYVVSTAGLFVDIAVLALLFSVLNVNIMAAKVVGTAAAFVVNFGGRQFFVFVRHPRWPSLSSLGKGMSRSKTHDQKSLF
jgi:putative flippase GtrA